MRYRVYFYPDPDNQGLYAARFRLYGESDNVDGDTVTIECKDAIYTVPAQDVFWVEELYDG
jgi:hypothetical protein